MMDDLAQIRAAACNSEDCTSANASSPETREAQGYPSCEHDPDRARRVAACIAALLDRLLVDRGWRGLAGTGGVDGARAAQWRRPLRCAIASQTRGVPCVRSPTCAAVSHAAFRACTSVSTWLSRNDATI